MKKYIFVKADTNDADYITEKSEITDEQIEIIKPLIEAIKNFTPYEVQLPGRATTWTHCHNWSSGERTRDDLGEKTAWEYYGEKGVSEDVLEVFEEFVPHGEYGIHTIESIDLLIVQEEIKLL